MKAEINNENKTNFFCLYFGQEVFTYRADEEGSYRVTFLNIDYLWKRVDHGNVEDYYLTLKPLENISDEDAINIWNVLVKPAAPVNTERKYELDYIRDWVQKTLQYQSGYNGNTWLKIYDFLRSRGYLLPWMGLSVEEIIEAGWAKYKEQ